MTQANGVGSTRSQRAAIAGADHTDNRRIDHLD